MHGKRKAKRAVRAIVLVEDTFRKQTASLLDRFAMVVIVL